MKLITILLRVCVVAIFFLGCQNNGKSEANTLDEPVVTKLPLDQLVKAIELPEREGYDLYDYCNIDAFNLHGDAFERPLALGLRDNERPQEYRLSNSRRALVVFDTSSKTSFIMVYDDFPDGEKRFVLGQKDSSAGAWLFRDPRPIHQGKQRRNRFLADIAVEDKDIPKNVFPLEGNVILEHRDGHLWKVLVEKVRTTDEVPPNTVYLAELKKRLKKGLAEKEQEYAKTHDSLLLYTIKTTRTSLEHIERSLRNGATLPAIYNDGILWKRHWRKHGKLLFPIVP